MTRSLRFALAALCGLVLSGLAGAAAADLRATALDLMNADREAHGLPPLEPDTALRRAAERHADDMLARDYFAHQSPEGKTVMDRFRAAGGGTSLAVGENLASCHPCRPDVATLRRFERGWMESPGHRANILSPGYTRFGFGYAHGEDGRLYAVQTFAGPGEAPPGRDGAAPQPLDVGAQRRQMLERINEARHAQGLAPLRLSEILSTAAHRLLARGPGLKLARLSDLRSDELYDAVPGRAGRQWRTLSLIAAECGGCGVRPTDTDIAHFAGQWLGPDGPGNALLDRRAEDLGFAMAADGEGRKVAVALIGTRR